MIDEALAGLLAGPVILTIATVDAARRPAIARASGAAADVAGGAVDVLVCGAQWPDAVGRAAPGGAIALGAVRPSDYRAVQIKGRILDVRAGTAAEIEAVRRYKAMMVEVLVALGGEPRLLPHAFGDRAIMRIRFMPSALFAQSPGPGAGRPIAAFV